MTEEETLFDGHDIELYQKGAYRAMDVTGVFFLSNLLFTAWYGFAGSTRVYS